MNVTMREAVVLVLAALLIALLVVRAVARSMPEPDALHGKASSVYNRAKMVGDMRSACQVARMMSEQPGAGAIWIDRSINDCGGTP